MFKSKAKETPKKESESKKAPESKKESKKEEPAQQAAQPQDNITQPDRNAEDTQGDIRENARKGEAISVPNTTGPNPINTPLDKK